MAGPTHGQSLAPLLDPRADAAIALVRIMSGKERSTDCLNALMAAYPQHRERDASLLHELVMGVLRRRAALEAILTPLLRRPLSGARPVVREILLCMAYQAYFLTRIPPHALVSASVAATERLAGRAAAAFVNAVGRRVAEKAADIDALPPQTRYSIPDHQMRRLRAVLGGEPTEDVLEAMSSHAPVSLRANRALTTPDDLIRVLATRGMRARRSSIAPDGVVLTEGRLSALSQVVPRLAVPQDEASQLVVLALDPRPGEKVLDLCAGGGVKTSHIEATTGLKAVAVDKDGAKLERNRDLCRQMCLPEPEVLVADIRAMPQGPMGDAVLLDAPCTGIGTVTRRPEVRYVRCEKDYARAALLQTELLRKACDLVKPGGRLVYAVCSFAPEEGPQVLERVLAERNDFAMEPAPFSGPFSRPDGTILTLPWRDGCDGFFVARLRRSRQTLSRQMLAPRTSPSR